MVTPRTIVKDKPIDTTDQLTKVIQLALARIPARIREKEGNRPNHKRNERCNVAYSACDVLCAAIECAGQPA